ncbi:Collagen alpha-5(VI) chain [Labeo rohita]|uniref:Collagen alpha-5(VI) chain n=1 Tax=Labeo rohita TaxID=84645 RepID=A0ABQ8MMJ8_LABRO|nr:Collagen alpha-5(VI) chain [Labeo rohita]
MGPTDGDGSGGGRARGGDGEPMIQGDTEDPEGPGGAQGSGVRGGGGDPEVHGGAGATEDQGCARGREEVHRAGGMERRGAAGGVESRGEGGATTDQGGAGGTMEPGGAGGPTGDGGDEGAERRGGAAGSEGRGGVQDSEAGGEDEGSSSSDTDDQGCISLLVLLDLSAAFDTIDHDILIDRLQNYAGIQGQALKWFRSYLSDRYHFVYLNGESSQLSPVKFRISYKIALLTYKALNGLAPAYLTSLLPRYNPSRSLRSQNSGLLVVPRIAKSTKGGRAFSHLAPKLWNSLPDNVRGSDTLSLFKSRLKTHLFSQAFK